MKITWQKRLVRGMLPFALLLFPMSPIAGIVEFIPELRIATEYDDNIRFRSNSNDADDDFAARVRPSIKLNYTTELFKFNSLAEIDEKRYFNQTDYDRTNQFYHIGAEYQAHPRWTLFTNGYYRKDETVDSQFEETGRVFERNRRKRYEAQGGARYNLTELTDIGTTFTYVRADFSSDDDDDYDRYTIQLPYSKRFQNQIDTLMLTPGYSHYNSDDNEEADDYRLTIGWEHLISETLTFDMAVGPRYTDVKQQDGTSNSKFGAVGRIGLAKRGETFSGEIRYSHDLRPTTEGEIVNVDRLFLFADKRLTERFGFRFNGNAYHSNRENTDAPDDEVISFELIPALYYMLTANHSLELSYRYRRQVELDEPGNPTRNQNSVTLQLILMFPKRWD
jgi:hypothetical protein